VLCFPALLAAALNAYALRDPVSPRLPVLPAGAGTDEVTNRTVVVTNPQAARPVYRWKVRVWFVNGGSLTGSADFPFGEFVVDHTLDGRRYYRRLTLAETASIRVRRWDPQARSSRGKQLYYFLPAVYRIIPRSGAELHMDKRMKMLDSIDVTTASGVTRVYSYFADYWVGGSNDGYWENSGSRVFASNRTRPHPQTVYRIDFLESLPQ